MKQKRKVIILVFAIILYGAIMWGYQTLQKGREYEEVCIVTKTLSKGEEITPEVIRITSMKKEPGKENYVKKREIQNLVATQELPTGMLLESSMTQPKESYLKPSEDTEFISIQLTNADDWVSYQLKKGSIVNVYYTGKTQLASQILDQMDRITIMSNPSESGFITVQLLEGVEMKGIYDKTGKELTGQAKEDRSQLDTIMIETDKEMVMKINNLKKYGAFSVSMIK